LRALNEASGIAQIAQIVNRIVRRAFAIELAHTRPCGQREMVVGEPRTVVQLDLFAFAVDAQRARRRHPLNLHFAVKRRRAQRQTFFREAARQKTFG